MECFGYFGFISTFSSQFVVIKFLKVNFYDPIARLANQAINPKFLNNLYVFTNT